MFLLKKYSFYRDIDLNRLIMKTLLSVVLFFLLSIQVESQQFYGVNISGDLTTAIEKFKTKVFSHKTTKDFGAIMKGRIVNQYVDLYIYVTPKTRTVFKMTLLYDVTNDFNKLNTQYSKMVNTMIEKYGKPDNVEEKFIFPYEVGDGYELTALQFEKCIYNSSWLDSENMKLKVELSKSKQLKVEYENVHLSLQNYEEEQMINSNIY
jgi:hypothetical protein